MFERFYYFYDLKGYMAFLKELREVLEQGDERYRILDVDKKMQVLEEVRKCKKDALGCVLIGIEKMRNYEAFPELIEELATHEKTPVLISFNAKVIKRRSPILYELLEKHWCLYGEEDRGFYQLFGTQKAKRSI